MNKPRFDRRPADTGLPRLWWGRRRWLLAGLLGNHLLQAALAVTVAWQLPALVRQWSQAQAWTAAPQTWWADAAWAAGLLLTLGALRHLSLAQGEALAQHYIAHVRLRLFDRLASLSPAGQHRRSRGAVMLRFVGDVQALRAWVGTGIAQCVAAACALSALLSALAWWSPMLGVLGLAGCLVAAAAMRLTLPRLQRAVQDSRRRQAQIASNIHDRINHLQRMQAAGSAGRERLRLGLQNRRLRQALMRRAWAQALHRSLLELCVLAMGAGLLLASVGGAAGATGGWSANGNGLGWGSAGSLDSGNLWAGVLGLLGLLSTPLRGIGLALESRAAAWVARERMLDFLAEPRRLEWRRRPPKRSAGKPGGAWAGAVTVPAHAPAPGGLGLELLRAGVPGRLRPLSAQLPWGTQLAVLGAAGSGKSTLAALLVRLEDPAQGQVLAAGVPLPLWTQARWRRQVSHLSADPSLTRGSLRHLLRQRCPQAGDAQLLQACALAGWPLPDVAALDRLLGDGGAPLNDQRRRQLALAAALVGPPAVLVIDDAEHALPGPAEQSLRNLLTAFEGSLLYTTAQPTLAALAPQQWTLQTAAVPTLAGPFNGKGIDGQDGTQGGDGNGDDDSDDGDDGASSREAVRPAPAKRGDAGRPRAGTAWLRLVVPWAP